MVEQKKKENFSLQEMDTFTKQKSLYSQLLLTPATGHPIFSYGLKGPELIHSIVHTCAHVHSRKYTHLKIIKIYFKM